MMKITNDYLIIILFFCVFSLNAQMPNGLDTLYGNEWIEEGQSYLRIPINEDGFYRISVEDIEAQGWPVASTAATDFQLFHEGQSIQLYNSNQSSSPLSTGEYLVFYGKKNQGALDQYLYRHPEEQQLNPKYSLIADEASYYLTYRSDGGVNYANIENDLTALPSPAPFVWQSVQNVYSDHFMKEYYRASGSTLYFSHFSIGEGYGNRSINQLLADGSTTQTETLVLENAYAAGPNPILETRYTAALFDHIQRLSVNETELRIDTFSNWRLLNITETLPNSTLTEGEARLLWEGFGGEKDEVCVGFTKVTYPAIPSANDNTFFEAVLPTNGTNQYLEISNWGANSAVVYDQTNGLRIEVDNITDGLLRLSLPASTQDRKLQIIATENDLPTVNLQPVNLNLPNLNDANYIILTNSLLRNNGDQVQAYADYRASIAGGSYRTAVVNVEDLFDLFAYGVQQHPLGIRNFVAWQRKINPDFKYLFIIGKGREYTAMRTEAALEEALGNTLFIPSFGFPASDNLMVSDINLPTPLVSIGRLPAINSGEVALYLNKIQSKEALAMNEQTIEARAWMKDVVHLGGGSTPSEKQSIKTNLNGMAAELEQGKFGAKVTSFFKTSSDPIQTSVTDQIFDRINKGVSIITFFGHSSAGTFDFNIDNPDNYDNAPKYPLLMSLGCYSGNMFGNFRSIGERFIFLENGGAGAFGASRGLGFIHSLNDFSRYFYKQMSNDYYGQPIGDGLRVSIQNFETRTDNAYGTLMEQFTLQGDPAFRLNPSPGPDFVFDAKKTRFEPSIINAQKDSFDVILTLQNIGKAVEDSIDVKIIRVFPSLETASSIIRVPAPAYANELRITLPTNGLNGVGVNKLIASINTSQTNPVTELPMPQAASNNNLQDLNGGESGVPFFIIDNTALPVWPPKYALLGDEDIVLKASTADVFAPERTYIMELDTNPSFEQPLERTIIVQKGGVVRWTPQHTWIDSTVYYWRVTPDSLDIGTSSYVWESSSFSYLNGIGAGWGQGHWGQWQDGNFNLMKLGDEKTFEFVRDLTNVRIRNKIWDAGQNRPGLFYDNGGLAGSVRPWNYLNAGMAAVVYELDDPNGFWRNPPPGEPFQAGDYGVPTGNNRVFAFPTSTIEERGNLMTFLNDVVPEEAYVFLFSVIKLPESDLNTQDWGLDSLSLPQNLFQLLEEQGATQVRNLEANGTIPYIFMYRKNTGLIAESFSLNIYDETNSEFDLPLTENEGSYQSPTVLGNTWNTLNWSFDQMDNDEENTLTIYAGNDLNTLEPIRIDTLTIAGAIDLNEIDISNKKYVRLKWDSYDDLNKSPANLQYWHITHQHLPDLAIDPSSAFFISKDSLIEGEAFRMTTAISNISDIDLTDSTEVTYFWQSNGELIAQEAFKIPPVQSEAFVEIEILLDSKGVKDNPQLILEVNAAAQPDEQTFINNTASKELFIDIDEIAPIVDVIFDGRKILDGEIISSFPYIVVEIQDENQYLPLDDPSLFDIRITAPDGSTMLIDPNSQTTGFVFEFDQDKNKAQINFQPELELEGFYQFQIKAKDASGNLAGRLLYEVSFEVILTTQLSNILPYPNPFSTQTRFVYTLTGRDAISNVSIQIMSISGRIVRHIRSEELGTLEVGTHLTDFVWDGTDEYGDQLANGIYLYRILAPPVGSDDAVLPTFGNDSIDTYFKNGLGKIVLLR